MVDFPPSLPNIPLGSGQRFGKPALPPAMLPPFLAAAAMGGPTVGSKRRYLGGGTDMEEEWGSEK